MTQLKILLPSEIQRKVCIVVGTRPGIIKMSPVIRELHRRDLPFFVLHTGQHYSYEMDRKFFEDLGLPEPAYKLESVRNYRTHGGQTAKMIEGIERVLLSEKPKVVLVGGDANTNLCGALAARKLHLVVGHIEAGLRSNDWLMPEEHNRIIIDHISDLLFPPTEKARHNLIEDNVKGRIIVTGNTVVDALQQNREIARRRSRILEDLGLTPQNYFLVTIHREENVDFRERIINILEALALVSHKYRVPIVFPTHPRTTKRLRAFGLLKQAEDIPNLRLMEPVGYLDFLSLLENACLVLTDSGGIQEESCILKVPCVTLRENTERPESVLVGANMVAGVGPDGILRAVRVMLEKPTDWENPFGDGRAAVRIIDVVEEVLNQ